MADPVLIDDDVVLVDDLLSKEPVVIVDEDGDRINNDKTLSVPSLSTQETIVLDDETPIITGIETPRVMNKQQEKSFIINLENNRLIDKIVKRCLTMENATGMPRVVHKTLLPLYKETSNRFKNSDAFRVLLKNTYKQLMNDPKHKFLHIKTLCEELKFGGSRNVPFVTLATNLKHKDSQSDCIELTSSSKGIDQNRNKNVKIRAIPEINKRNYTTLKKFGRRAKKRKVNPEDIKKRSVTQTENTGIIDLDDSETESSDLDGSKTDVAQNDVIIVEGTEPIDQRNDNSNTLPQHTIQSNKVQAALGKYSNKENSVLDTTEKDSSNENKLIQKTLEKDSNIKNKVIPETLPKDSNRQNKLMEATIETDSNTQNKVIQGPLANDSETKSLAETEGRAQLGGGAEPGVVAKLGRAEPGDSAGAGAIPRNLSKDEIIARLEERIAFCKNAIDKLEEAEVTTDTYGSAYHVCSRYKEDVVACYKKICQLTGNSQEIVKRQEIRLQVTKGHPPGPAKRLEDFLNGTIDATGAVPFPDFSDVLKCVVESKLADNIAWNNHQTMQEAIALFRQCGQALRKRRQKREYRDLLCLIRNNEESDDPAERDPLLLTKLEENKRIAKAKEEAILDSYVAMEQNTAPQYMTEFDSDKDSSNSECESVQTLTATPTTPCSSSNVNLYYLIPNNLNVCSTMISNNYSNVGQSSNTNNVFVNNLVVTPTLTATPGIQNPLLLTYLLTAPTNPHFVKDMITNKNESAIRESENQSAIRESENQIAIRQSENQIAIRQSENQSSIRESENQIAIRQSENQIAIRQSENQSSIRESENQIARRESESQSSIRESENQIAIRQSENQSSIRESENQIARRKSESQSSIRESENQIARRESESQSSIRESENQIAIRESENQSSIRERLLMDFGISNEQIHLDVLPARPKSSTPDSMSEYETTDISDSEESVNPKTEFTITETTVGFNTATSDKESDMISLSRIKIGNTDRTANNRPWNVSDMHNTVSSSTDGIEQTCDSNSSPGASVKTEDQIKTEPLDIQNMLDELGDGFVCRVFDIEDPFLIIEISSDESTDDE